MRRLRLLAIDLALIALCTVFALALRDNFDLNSAKLAGLAPYTALTLAVSILILPTFGVSRTVWKSTGLVDYLKIASAVVVIVASAVVLGFSLNRLEFVARSLPILQALLMVVCLTGVRILMRLLHASRARAPQLMEAVPGRAQTTVLVVGLNRLAELYLRAVAEFGADRVRVAGLVAAQPRHVGRIVLQHPVLGRCEDLPRVLRDLGIHGMAVDRIIVAVPGERLTDDARAALAECENEHGIAVEVLSDSLGFGHSGDSVAGGDSASPDPAALPEPELSRQARRPYWRFKRVFDVAASLTVMLLLAPVVVIVAIVVALDVGSPLTFWQERPGLGGRPIRLFKFRTMRAAFDAEGQRLADEARVSAVGRFLRRTRLDELPQLLSVLKGEMSFVGPRPLLHRDQSPRHRARLLVRPGLTGWAQVKGGRAISSDDKAALDIWYVRHAGFLLDVRILALTVPVLLRGERADRGAIDAAWSELTAPVKTVTATGAGKARGGEGLEQRAA